MFFTHCVSSQICVPVILAAIIVARYEAFCHPRRPSLHPPTTAGHYLRATGSNDAGAYGSSPVPAISLGSPHNDSLTAAGILHRLAEHCSKNNITLDVYGDFDDESKKETSFLRRFEQEIVHAFAPNSSTQCDERHSNIRSGRGSLIQDAVFMPSGVMAQGIALLIHSGRGQTSDGSPTEDPAEATPRFACHETCHLLLHEEDAYRELLGMEAVVVSTRHKCAKGSISIPAMTLEDVTNALSPDQSVSTLIVEVPLRELGGKLTPWQDLVDISKYCRRRGIAVHCDGARIFEAAAGYGKPLSDIAELFDSIYISCYKGLGALSGSVLLGSVDFCQKARTWLCRFGGNLYTLTPYAVSGWAGFRRHWCLEGDDGSPPLSFAEKTEKLRSLVASLSSDETITSIVTFDPAVPETCMVHGYLVESPELCQQALDNVQDRCGIRVVRVRPVRTDAVAYQKGFRSKFELVMGENNGKIPCETFLQGWSEFALEVKNRQS